MDTQVNRREFLGLLGGTVTMPMAAGAQPSSGRPLVGWLSPSSANSTTRIYRGLRDGLRELGYVEGRNIWLDIRYAEGVLSRIPAMAAEMVARKPDLIVASSTPGVVAASRATQTIPIVMTTLVDPVALGVVKSIARPGGNVTGIWTFGGADALIGKRVALLKEIVPTLSRMAVIVAADDPTSAIAERHLPLATARLGVNYKIFTVRTVPELKSVLALAADGGMQGLFFSQNPFFISHRVEIAALVASARLPAIYGYREQADAGGLMSYGSSLPGALAQAARFIDKILKGAKPADLPVEQADKYELVVNNKTAKTLGLKIPESFLLRADEVIE